MMSAQGDIARERLQRGEGAGWKRVTLRVPRWLYVLLSLASEDQGISINLFLVEAFDWYAAPRVAQKRAEQERWEAAHPGQWGGPWNHRGYVEKVGQLNEVGEPILHERARAVPRGELAGAHRLVLRVPELLYDELRVCAMWDGVSASQAMLWALQAYLRAHGVGWH